MSEEEKKTLPWNGGYPMHSFETLRELYFTYIHDPKNRKLIEDAYLLAKEKHAGVFRKSGEPYINHPLEVAYILAELQCGPETLAAGLLHDTVEDTDLTVEEIKERFGEDVALIVDSLTKIQRMKLSRRTEQDFEAEDHRKIFLGMARDVRVIVVKLADRLHNLRTIDALSKERQMAISKETLEVFAPIAHRLGIYRLESELEDLSLKHLEPKIYDEILAMLNSKEAHRQASLDNLKKRIADLLLKSEIPFRMESRVKSIYSIYRKMYKKHYNFDEIYDVLAIRVITETVMNCYEILGIVHATYTPLPGRFKDYIAMPKPNMYQSLHTSIIAGDGNIYEIQIRTEEMDSVAESGIAAHWRYKEGISKSAKEEQRDIEEKLHWFRDFVSISSENAKGKDAKEYMDALESDVFSANVYVFTPLGKVVDLPSGATTIDFAYRIHSKVGDSAVGAIVNGVMVPLGTVLKTGDVVEIKTAKNASGPNDSWLEIAKTAGAKSKIRKALQKKNAFLREDNIARGKEACLEAFGAQGIGEGEMEKYLNSDAVFERFSARDLDSLYENVANKNPAPLGLIEFLGLRKKQSGPKIEKRALSHQIKNPVLVEGADNIAVSLGKCCCPIPGDRIVGFVSKGKGIIVHREDCPNVRNGAARLIPVRWNEALGTSKYQAIINVYASDRSNLVADVLSALSAKGVQVVDLKCHLITSTMNDVVHLTVYVTDARTLEDVFADLKAVKGVYECERVTR